MLGTHRGYGSDTWPVATVSGRSRGRDSRAQILLAARELFAEQGFDRASMRAIAARAGVDAGLIYYHFKGKDDLLKAALTLPTAETGLPEPIPAGCPDPGAQLMSAVLHLWDDDEDFRQQATAIIRTALSHPVAAATVRPMHEAFVRELIAQVVAPDQQRLRAALIGSHVLGLMIGRHIARFPAVAEASVEALVAASAPTINRLLTEPLDGGYASS